MNKATTTHNQPPSNPVAANPGRECAAATTEGDIAQAEAALRAAGIGFTIVIEHQMVPVAA